MMGSTLVKRRLFAFVVALEAERQENFCCLCNFVWSYAAVVKVGRDITYRWMSQKKLFLITLHYLALEYWLWKIFWFNMFLISSTMLIYVPPGLFFLLAHRLVTWLINRLTQKKEKKKEKKSVRRHSALFCFPKSCTFWTLKAPLWFNNRRRHFFKKRPHCIHFP